MEKVKRRANRKRSSEVLDWSTVPVILGPQDVLRLRLFPGGKAAVYALFHRKDFPAVRHGKRLIVGRDAFRRWLEGPPVEVK